MEFNLTLVDCESNKFWSQLFQIINRSYSLIYFTYNKKRYVNCTNGNYNDTERIIKLMSDNGIKCCHKDHKCDGYFKHTKNTYGRKISFPHEITYTYNGSFNFDEDFHDLDDSDDDSDGDSDGDCDGDSDGNSDYDDKYNNKIHKTIANIINHIGNTNPINVVFVAPINITIVNKRGFNDDHRGSDHTLINLPFVTKIDLENRFTLYDLLTSNTNLKSHKFDNWYELYCNATCKNNNGQITVELNFDHGS